MNAQEYDALMDIRGLQEGAYFMVATAKRSEKGNYTLCGSPDAFDQLANDLCEEIEFALSEVQFASLGKNVSTPQSRGLSFDVLPHDWN